MAKFKKMEAYFLDIVLYLHRAPKALIALSGDENTGTPLSSRIPVYSLSIQGILYRAFICINSHQTVPHGFIHITMVTMNINQKG